MGSFFGANRVFDSAKGDFWVRLVHFFFAAGGRGLGGRPSHATGLNRVFDRWLGAGWGAARERGRLREVVDVFGSARMGANK